jgi:hypothetical protein
MAQRRKGGGTGRGPQTFWKHDQIDRYMKVQLPILAKRQEGRGLIIDMHAGDGEPVEHPIADLFAGRCLSTTPDLAVGAAERFGADVILCERNREARKALEEKFGDRRAVIEILPNNELLTDFERVERFQDDYGWVLVLNDPNGYSDQSEEVMQGLSSVLRICDFIIVVNLHSFVRPAGLPKDSGTLACRRARESADDHSWMSDGAMWMEFLDKEDYRSQDGKLSAAMQARVFLVSNFIPERVR